MIIMGGFTLWKLTNWKLTKLGFFFFFQKAGP